MTTVDAPLPAASTAVVRWPPVDRPMTLTRSPRRAAGSAGAALRHVPPLSVRMPVRPALLQSPATSGCPAGVQAAAVRLVRPHARAAAVWLSARSVVSRVQAAPSFVLVSTVPAWVSASSLPCVSASAPGTSASPAPTRLPSVQWAPPSGVSASGEKVRSWLGRKPVSSEPGPVTAAMRPPLEATPGGVASFQVPPAVRLNSSQKLLYCAAEPPISTTAQPVPPGAASDVVSAGMVMPAPAVAAVGGAALLPQAVTASARRAARATEAEAEATRAARAVLAGALHAVGLLIRAPARSGPQSQALSRRTTSSLRCRDRDRS